MPTNCRSSLAISNQSQHGQAHPAEKVRTPSQTPL
uniref:Uncharacterized protein n=1 Tax=Arundo donax TaxID=35708 RepID=A0A0A9AAR1_ARUDO